MQRNIMEDFRRDISYHCFKQEDGTLLLTATLRDIFHDIEVQVVACAATLVIASAKVDFRRFPTDDCLNVANRLERLVGFTIGKGLNRAIIDAVGGGEGCGNIRNLLLGVLPLALNVRAAAGIMDEREMLDTIHTQLVGTCGGYARPVPKNAST